MSKFSTSEKWIERFMRRDNAAINYEGGLAYRWDDKATLATMAACSLVNERNFYGDTTGKVDALARRVAAGEPEWFVKLAIFLREELHLRSISQKTAAIAAITPECRPYLKKALDRIIIRTDDLIELAALLKDNRHGLTKSTPHIVRKYAAARLNRLDNWECVKYRKESQFGLRHMLKLYHPKPAGERQRALFRYLSDPQCWENMTAEERRLLPEIAAFERFKTTDVKDVVAIQGLIKQGRLPWEMVLPHTGSSKEVWNVLGYQMPIMALIRNLRNLQESGALKDSMLKRHITNGMLRNEKVILNSRQLPFRWYSAWKAVSRMNSQIADALVDAMNISTKNLPRLDGTTVIACDNSGSMSFDPISDYSDVYPIDIAAILGAVAVGMCERRLVYVFGENIAQVPVSEHDTIFKNMERIRNTDVGHSTNAYKVISAMIEDKIHADKLIVLTDMEIYDDSYSYGQDKDFRYLLGQYRKHMNPNLMTFVINLMPYEYFILPQDANNVTVISGWNQEILRYIKYTSNTKGGSLVEQIDKVKLN